MVFGSAGLFRQTLFLMFETGLLRRVGQPFNVKEGDKFRTAFVSRTNEESLAIVE
jgi:hypothetical protein